MVDAGVLARALRAGSRLRDKVIVLDVDASITSEADKLELFAADLALARSSGIRAVCVVEPGSGAGPLDAQAPALSLVRALERYGERGLTIPASGLVTVHRVPPEAVAAAPGTPAFIPVVVPTALLHLSTLGYVPVLLLPVADAAGAAIELDAVDVAAYVAHSLGAVLLVRTSPKAHALQAAAPSPSQPKSIVAAANEPGRLIADILLNAPESADLALTQASTAAPKSPMAAR